MKVRRNNLIRSLQVAIETRQEKELQLGHKNDSELLTEWKEMLAMIAAGEDIELME